MGKHPDTWFTKALAFEGRGWPGAHVVERRDVEDFRATSVAGELKTVSVAFVKTGGRGRGWTALEATGFWRSFAEADLQSDTAVEDFLQRHGDPEDMLSPKVAIHTGNWEAIQSPLRIVAGAWGDPDSDGVSNCRNEIPVMVQALLEREAEKNHLSKTDPIFDSVIGIRLKPATLASYMFLSAVTMLYERTPLKRCAYCGDWMKFDRSTAKTCSTACRNALGRQEKALRRA